MFALTPQEKSVLSWLLAICVLGAVIRFALDRDARPFRWINTAGQKPKPHLPDINTATAEAFDKVPGIGPKTAQNIVAYRNSHGPFASLDDLRKVHGITKKNFPKIHQFYLDGQKP